MYDVKVSNTFGTDREEKGNDGSKESQQEKNKERASKKERKCE